MVRFILFFSCLLLSGSSLRAQYLNWFLSAQTGSSGYHSTGMHGAVLAGFKTETGQQVSFGPVVKGYLSDRKFGNLIGARLYSEMNLSEKLGIYMQCDVSNGDQFHSIDMRSPLRLEAGIGINYMLGERIGVGAGYNFDDYNPLTNSRQSSPALKLVYLIPLGNNGWRF